MPDTKPTPHHIAAWFLIVFLTLGFILAVATFGLRWMKMEPDASGLQAFLSGKVISSFEKKFEENLVGRDQIVGVWGAIEYGLFKSGGKKVVIGADGWLYTSEEFEHLKEAAQAEERFLALADKINNHLKAQNIKLIVALVPSKARIYPEHLGNKRFPADRDAVYVRVRQKLQAKGIETPDIAAQFMTGKASTPLYLKLDTHWTPEGAKLAAAVVAKAAEGVKLEKTEFKVEPAESMEVEGDLEKYIKTGVFSPVFAPARDVVAQYKVSKATVDDGGLFSDEVMPVALIGTSYSAIDTWNFEGALKLVLKSDVLNLADKGQGPLEPMAKFLEKNNLKDSPLKLVIWEVPERFIPVSYGDVKFPDYIEEVR